MYHLVHLATADPNLNHLAVDYVAIAGILGTLAGAALGAYVAWKTQQLQVEHEDRTRFHDRRLTIYSDFT